MCLLTHCLQWDSWSLAFSFPGNSQIGGFLRNATHDTATGLYWSCMFHVGINLQPVSKHFQLHYLRLPKDISEDHVILMDCTVSTGAAAMMAVRVLLVGAPDCSQVRVACNELPSSCSIFSWVFFSFSGPWRSWGQDLACVVANGRNGSPFSGLRIPTGQNHHHSCWQGGQWSLPHHTRHRWVMGKRRHFDYKICGLLHYIYFFSLPGVLDLYMMSITIFQF